MVTGHLYRARFIPQAHLPDIVNLYHLARTALAGQHEQGRHARMLWAAREYAREHDVSEVHAYMDLDGALS